MLTRLIRWQLTVFAIVTVFSLTAVALLYLHVPAMLGIGTYNVVVNLAQSGGLYPHANVTYRGTTVGDVTAVALTRDYSVDAHLELDSSTKIPSRVIASVRSMSAIGEQYLDLVPEPGATTAQVLHDDSHIDRAHTTLPGNVAELFREARRLVDSLGRSRLRDVLRETFKAFDGSGADLARLLESARLLVEEADHNVDDTLGLIDQAGPVLDAQVAAAPDIKAAADGLARLTDHLRGADPAVASLLGAAPSAADAATETFTGIRPSFPVLAANLANFGRIGVIYHKSIEQILVIFPALTGALLNVAEQLPLDEGAKADFKFNLGDPPPCFTGFIPPPLQRNPADETLRDIPQDLYCKVPQNDPTAVRGARNYPCQEYPGKRAPTVQLCRDPVGYVPLGNNPWRGPPVPVGTPITDPRNIVPLNKYPYIPPQADYDPGPPVTELPPGVPPGPGPADTAPYPKQTPPVTQGPQPPPLPFLAPPDQQVPPYGRPPEAPPAAQSESPATPNTPGNGGAALPAEATPSSFSQRVRTTTYDPASGQFQDPDGHIGVFSSGAFRQSPAETWVDLMTMAPAPR